MEAMKAVVNCCMSNRGFGFLKDKSGVEWFFHFSNFNGKPRPGALVSFELADPNRLGQKPQAVNIQILEDAPSPLNLLAGVSAPSAVKDGQ